MLLLFTVIASPQGRGNPLVLEAGSNDRGILTGLKPLRMTNYNLASIPFSLIACFRSAIFTSPKWKIDAAKPASTLGNV